MLLFLLLLSFPVSAAYKIRPWNPRPVETYPARFAGEGITIAVDPLFTDALAAQVFDSKDMIARGIMPLAIVIFNSNSYAVDVEGASVELITGGDHLRTLDPINVVQRLFEGKAGRGFVIQVPLPIPRIKIMQSQPQACQDFNQKYLAIKRVEPQATAGGFLFFPFKDTKSLRQDLAEARIYIPHIQRSDTGAEMLFFEIDLKAAIDAAAKK